MPKKQKDPRDEAYKLYKEQLLVASQHDAAMQHAQNFLNETARKVDVISGSLISMEKLFGFEREKVVEELKREAEEQKGKKEEK
jgi:hypothetical protein